MVHCQRSIMENINNIVFLWFNASAHPSLIAVDLATVLAEFQIWIVPIVIAVIWLRGHESQRRTMLAATVAGLIALSANQLIGMVWWHPRPFMIGLGHTLIPHAADSSFPSDHLSLWWAVAFSFLLAPSLRLSGIILCIFGLPLAWARIYLGVHFPFDMAGAAIVAMLSAILMHRLPVWCLDAIYLVTIRIHCRLLSRFIANGWVRGTS
ncbi:putative transport permease [Herbaspirillum sp. GW103]|nr:putative transport permease [Herbaspirillum sp. GW103]